ncbi:MAG: hypothetical protein QXP53_00620 [Candidatus Pacearchaeota archaeon]
MKINLEVLSRKKKKEIHESMAKNYGIEINQQHNFIKTGKYKLRIFTGNISESELNILNYTLKIDNIGLFFANVKEKELRLSFDAAIMFGKKATKNVIKINKDQVREWMQGKDIEILNIKFDSRFVLIKYKKDILGCGKVSGNRLLNFVPKERRTNLIT